MPVSGGRGHSHMALASLALHLVSQQCIGRLKLRRCPFQDTSMKSSMDGYPVKQAKLVQITKNNSTMNVLGNRPEGTQESRREGNM